MANQNSKSKNKKNTTKAGTNSKKVTSNKDVKKDTKVVAKSENKKKWPQISDLMKMVCSWEN